MQIPHSVMYEINPAIIWFESERAAVTLQRAPSPDCLRRGFFFFFSTVKKQFASFPLARQEYFSHYPTFKHRAL